MAASRLDAYGRIGILVNNSAIGGSKANLVGGGLDEWNDVIAANHNRKW